MKIEYQITDTATSNKELLTHIEKVEKFSFINKVTVLPSCLKYLKSRKPERIKLSTIIDFPLGLNSTAIRLACVKEAITNGAESIEIVMQSAYITNKNNPKIKEDIEQCLQLCSDNGVNLHYMTEYRLYNYGCLSRLTKFLLNSHLNDIYISTGHRLDNIYDHIIAIAMILKENPEANIICNANIYSQEHLELLEESKIRQFRVNSLNTLSLISKKYSF